MAAQDILPPNTKASRRNIHSSSSMTTMKKIPTSAIVFSSPIRMGFESRDFENNLPIKPQASPMVFARKIIQPKATSRKVVCI